MRKNWTLLFALLAIFSLVAAACGSDDPVATDDTPADEPETDEPEADEDPPAEEPDDSAGPADFCLDIAGSDDATGDGSGVTVGMTFDLLGRGDQSFNDAAACGLDRAVEVFGISFNEIVPTDESARETDLQLNAENATLVFGNGFSFRDGALVVAEVNPDVHFAITDDTMLDFDTFEAAFPNAAGMTFAEQEGSFLVGVAAALQTESNKLGFIGGVSNIPGGLIERFEAGFIAGAKAVNPDIEFTSKYITDFPTFDGFFAPDQGKEVALAMYSEGADVIYAAAGLTGSGMFAGAKEYTDENGSKVWGIGVDSDQFLTVDGELQEFVLTSMLKRVDVAVFQMIEAELNGTFEAGNTLYDLARGGVDYSKSGGFVDAYVAEIDGYKAQIIAGDIVVPVDPAEALAG
ncbi:MAG: BMP family ABC transporter substrate-binding protein [Acidimicrobiales bacterium]